MATIHVLTQYIWPDAAPTGLYAEHLCARLEQRGCDVRLVGGKGGYRALRRPKPVEQIIHLDHYTGRRGNLYETVTEYASVTRAFRDYLARFVRHDDVAVVTSAPPNTVTLARIIRRRGGRAIYWLQDYYPELIRGLCDYPNPLRKAFCRYWDHQLLQWDQVVKIGGNLKGPLHNSCVIRNWPTLSFTDRVAPEPQTAMYSGNLGYGHDVGLLIAACKKLRDAGYRITMRCDGRGVSKLPHWLQPQPLEDDPTRLRDELIRHEVHLIAAHPKITRAIFPSKVWNTLAAGRGLVCAGFAGEMAAELEIAKHASYGQHIEQWLALLQPTIRRDQATLVAAA